MWAWLNKEKVFKQRNWVLSQEGHSPTKLEEVSCHVGGGLWEGDEPQIVFDTWEQPQLTACKKAGTSVLKLQETEFCQQLKSAWRWVFQKCLQMRTQPIQHLVFSFVLPQSENPAMPCVWSGHPRWLFSCSLYIPAQPALLQLHPTHMPDLPS